MYSYDRLKQMNHTLESENVKEAFILTAKTILSNRNFQIHSDIYLFLFFPISLFYVCLHEYVGLINYVKDSRFVVVYWGKSGSTISAEPKTILGLVHNET